MCSALHLLGAEEIQGENPSYPSAPIPTAGSVSGLNGRGLLSGCSQHQFSRERLEICTMKSAQPEHLQSSQPAALCSASARPLTHSAALSM